MKKIFCVLIMVFAIFTLVSCANEDEHGYHVDCDDCLTVGFIESSCTSCRCTSCSGTGIIFSMCYNCGGTGGRFEMVPVYNYLTGMYDYQNVYRPCSCMGGQITSSCSSCVGGYKASCNKCNETRINLTKCTTCKGKGYTIVPFEE